MHVVLHLRRNPRSLDEIFALADRIVVMSEGRAVHEVAIANAQLSTIGRYMAGHG